MLSQIGVHSALCLEFEHSQSLKRRLHAVPGHSVCTWVYTNLQSLREAVYSLDEDQCLSTNQERQRVVLRQTNDVVPGRLLTATVRERLVDISTAASASGSQALSATR